MTHLKRSATYFIREMVPDGNLLGIVSFSGISEVQHPLAGVESSTRDAFTNVINGLTANGGTCIGCGLKTAIKVIYLSMTHFLAAIP